MAPRKSKLAEEESRERNKKYWKKYRNSIKQKQPNAETERKQYHICELTRIEPVSPAFQIAYPERNVD